MFPKINNLEFFPSEILFSIFNNINNIDLLNLSRASNRFEDVARVLFEKNKCFMINNAFENKKLYLEMFERFNIQIEEMVLKNCRDINKNHWVSKIMNQYSNQIQKLRFDTCFFDEINVTLRDHKNITELSVKNCHHSFKNIFDYPTIGIRPLKLKKLEIFYDNHNEYFTSTYALTRTFKNHPTLESLKLSYNLKTWIMTHFY